MRDRLNKFGQFGNWASNKLLCLFSLQFGERFFVGPGGKCLGPTKIFPLLLSLPNNLFSLFYFFICCILPPTKHTLKSSVCKLLWGLVSCQFDLKISTVNVITTKGTTFYIELNGPFQRLPWTPHSSTRYLKKYFQTTISCANSLYPFYSSCDVGL